MEKNLHQQQKIPTPPRKQTPKQQKPFSSTYFFLSLLFPCPRNISEMGTKDGSIFITMHAVAWLHQKKTQNPNKKNTDEKQYLSCRQHEMSKSHVDNSGLSH